MFSNFKNTPEGWFIALMQIEGFYEPKSAEDLTNAHDASHITIETFLNVLGVWTYSGDVSVRMAPKLYNFLLRGVDRACKWNEVEDINKASEEHIWAFHTPLLNQIAVYGGSPYNPYFDIPYECKDTGIDMNKWIPCVHGAALKDRKLIPVLRTREDVVNFVEGMILLYERTVAPFLENSEKGATDESSE